MNQNQAIQKHFTSLLGFLFLSLLVTSCFVVPTNNQANLVSELENIGNQEINNNPPPLPSRLPHQLKLPTIKMMDLVVGWKPSKKRAP